MTTDELIKLESYELSHLMLMIWLCTFYEISIIRNC